MTNIIKKLNKNNITFSINNNSISFNIDYFNNYTITKINNNKFLLSNNCDSFYLTYESLINSLNKYQLIKNW